MEKFIKLFEPSYNDLKECIGFIKRTEATNSQEINSHAVDFLNIFALVAVGFTWLEFISISLNKIDNKHLLDSAEKANEINKNHEVNIFINVHFTFLYI